MYAAKKYYMMIISLAGFTLSMPGLSLADEIGETPKAVQAQASFSQASKMFKEICLEGLPDFRNSKEFAIEKYGASFDDRKDNSWTSLDFSSFINSISIYRGKKCSIYVDIDGRDDQLVQKFQSLLSDLPTFGVYHVRLGQDDDLDHHATWEYLFSASEHTSHRLLKKYSYKNTRLGDSFTLTLSVSYRKFQCTISERQKELSGLIGEPPREDLLLSDAERWC